MGIAEQVAKIFQNPIDRFIDGAEDQIGNLPIDENAKRILRTLLPFFKGGAWPLPSQWTSWQWFTGEAEDSKNVMGEILDLIGVTLENEKGYFSVQSEVHPRHVYRCEFSLNRGGYAYGIPLGRILRFLSKALRKLSKGAPWVRMAARALHTGLTRIARFSKRLQKVIDSTPNADLGPEIAIKLFNDSLKGWGSQIPLQTIRRNAFNAQDPTVEAGPPTGLFGPIFVVDIGVTIIGNLKLLLLFMGGPVHWSLGWMPLAYKYVGVNFGYGIQLSADVALNIAYGHVQKITEYDSVAGTKREIPKPR